MKVKLSLILFSALCSLLFGAFTALPTQIDDKTLLDIIANHTKLPLFNYTVKMAAVDARPYNPNDPIIYPPTTIFKSRSEDAATHGGKIFRLRVKDDSNYAYDLTQPAGQTIVMATYNYEAAKTTLGDGKSLRLNDTLHLKPTTDGAFYIMYKPEIKDYPTDSGWVYGVVSADGKKVISKGLITSCMKCHTQSPTDRMLGAK